MRWNICGVLLVVGSVTAGETAQGPRRYTDLCLDTELITTISRIGEGVEKVQLGMASWYCYEFTTPEEETIAKSEVAKFAGGANKEGKIIKVGSLIMLTRPDEVWSHVAGSDWGFWSPELKFRYCALASANTFNPSSYVNTNKLTPNNNKIKYITFNSTKFYAKMVMYPSDESEGFREMKYPIINLGFKGPFPKVDFYHPTVISSPPDTRRFIMYPEYDD